MRINEFITEKKIPPEIYNVHGPYFLEFGNEQDSDEFRDFEKYDDPYYQSVSAWFDGHDQDEDMFNDFKELLKIKKYYPEALQPIPGIVYRGTRYNGILKPTNSMIYRPRSPIQSWTYNLTIAMKFSLGPGGSMVTTSEKTWTNKAKLIMEKKNITPIVLKTKVTNNFLFNPDFGAEEETIRVSKTPFKVEVIHPLL